MKKKNFSKRLVLNKDIIANLDSTHLKNVKGGELTVQWCTIEVNCELTGEDGRAGQSCGQDCINLTQMDC